MSVGGAGLSGGVPRDAVGGERLTTLREVLVSLFGEDAVREAEGEHYFPRATEAGGSEYCTTERACFGGVMARRRSIGADGTWEGEERRFPSNLRLTNLASESPFGGRVHAGTLYDLMEYLTGANDDGILADRDTRSEWLRQPVYVREAGGVTTLSVPLAPHTLVWLGGEGGHADDEL
jgi:hypothetical protein